MTNESESERLAALQRFEILDTPPDGTFDRVTELASLIFNMPISIVSLVDEDRIWFKSKYGLDAVEQIERDPGLCASAILSSELYVVENAIQDPRTLNNPLVRGELGLRFYAAAPLRTRDGFNLGTICIIDKKQRYLTSNQLQILEKLGQIVMDDIELRLSALQRARDTDREIDALKAENERLRSGNQESVAK